MSFMKSLFFLSLIILLACCSSLKKNTSARFFEIDKKWARYTPAQIYLGPRKNHRMSSILFGDYIIQGNAIDGISAYKKSTGALVWTRRFDGGVEVGAALSGSNILFGANDGFFYALDAYNGKTRWSFPIKSEGLGVPTVSQGVVYFVAGNNTTYAISINSGEQLWFYSRVISKSMTVRGSAQPTVVGDSVYIGYSDGALVSLNKKTGSLKWERSLARNARFADIDAQAVFHKGRLYVTAYDGQLFSVNPDNGNIFWSTEDGGFTTPEIFEDRIFTSTSTGEVVALELSSGKRLWTYSLKNSVATAPVYYRGLLIFGEWQGQLVALDAMNGKKVTTYSTGRGVTSTPAIDAEAKLMYVITADANLFALALNWKKQSEKWEWEKSPYQ